MRNQIRNRGNISRLGKCRPSLRDFLFSKVNERSFRVWTGTLESFPLNGFYYHCWIPGKYVDFENRLVCDVQRNSRASMCRAKDNLQILAPVGWSHRALYGAKEDIIRIAHARVFLGIRRYSGRCSQNVPSLFCAYLPKVKISENC